MENGKKQKTLFSGNGDGDFSELKRMPGSRAYAGTSARGNHRAYEDAINAMDAEEMLACMDESTRNAMTAGLDVTMGIVGAVTGVDLGIEAEDLIDMMPLLTAIAENTGLWRIPRLIFRLLKP